MHCQNGLSLQFQSTLPRRERLGAPFKLDAFYNHFNPRSREGSDRQKWSGLHSQDWNFNPRSREGSDIYRCFIVPMILISIHAPAKGATTVL